MDNNERKNLPERYTQLFDEQSKADAFDEIARRFYAGNFGQMTKTDFETLMFRLYLNRQLAMDGNATSTYSDFKLSKELGITQAKVRSLRMQKELRYPGEGLEWKTVFVNRVQYARYDEVKHLVKVSIPDIIVLTELRNFVEENGWYDEYQLNPKLFQCRLDIFVEICNHLNDAGAYTIQLNEDAKIQLSEMVKSTKREEEKNALTRILSGTVEDGVKDFLISAGKEGIVQLLKILSFEGITSTAIQFLIAVLSR